MVNLLYLDLKKVASIVLIMAKPGEKKEELFITDGRSSYPTIQIAGGSQILFDRPQSL